MNTVVISASMRPNSQSIKIANYLHRVIQAEGHTSQVLDLAVMRLPLYDDQDHLELKLEVTNIKEVLAGTDSYVVVTPEWNGMASIGFLNMLHYIEHEMAHKPIMLVGVSATRGGSYPLQQLRTMGYKNRHYIIIPENIVVTDCKNVFNDDNLSDDAPDIYLKKRANYALKVLAAYADALAGVRSSGVIDFEAYPNGM